MKNNSDDTVRQVLINYLEQNHYRKTPERFAVLETAYSFASYFSIQDLSDRLVEKCFPVSRATLYNTIKLLMGLRLVSCLRLRDGIRYKACFNDNTCSQVCKVCGKVKDIDILEFAGVLGNTRLSRFRKENFSVYIYGVCSTCQAMLTRMKRKGKQIKRK